MPLPSFLLPLLCGLLGPGRAVASPLAVSGATLHPVASPPIEDGVLVVDEGRILALGPRASTPIPEGATLLDAAGLHLIPGLIDLHSHIGGGSLHEGLGPIQGGLSAIDAIDPTHISIQRAQSGGITTAHVMPGSGTLLGGQTALISLRDRPVIDDLLICQEPDAGPRPGPRRRALVCGGVKMANGTNPQGEGKDPRSRMGAAYLQRAAFVKARERRVELDKMAKGGKRVEPDPMLDGLVEILRGDRIVHFHSHRADDMVTAIRLQQEFGFDLVLHHGSEGFKVAELLAEAGVPVAINVLDTPGGKEETLERRLDNPAILHRAGVQIALITDDPVQDSRLLLRSGALAVRGGLPEDVALKALTATPAALVGLQDRKGALAPGLDADFVLLSGPPFSTWTHVLGTWVGGERVFDRADPADHRVATGGDALPLPHGVP